MGTQEYCQFCGIAATKVFRCRRGQITVWDDFFQPQWSRGNYISLAYTDLVVEWKWRTPQVATANWVTKFVKLQMFHRLLNLTCGSILVQKSKNEEGDRQKAICRHCQTLTKTLTGLSVMYKVQLLFNKCHYRNEHTVDSVTKVSGTVRF